MGNLPEIDFVYPWVDGDDPVFAARLQEWRKKYAELRGEPPHPEADAPRRFRGLDNLRFSLRSVAQNAPWFRKLFIVTNGQVPDWLRQSERVQIVEHSQIFPDPAHLPTFSVFPIEWSIPNIPGLGRYFIYMNDDCFFTSPTSPEYFFGRNGLQKLFFSSRRVERNPAFPGLWDRMLRTNAELLDARFGARDWYPEAHGPTLFDSHRLAEVRSNWAGEIDKVFSHKFRDETDAKMQFLYTNSLLALDERKSTSDRYEAVTLADDELRLIHVGADGLPWQQEFQEVLARRPRFLCLNDDGPAENFAEIEMAHRAFLKALFPKPSAFEKGLFRRIFGKR